MKKHTKSLLFISLITISTLISCTPQVENKTVTLKEIINTINTGVNYDYYADIPYALSTSTTDGISVNLEKRDNAIEYSETNKNTLKVYYTVGYADCNDGVFRYSYNDNGDIEPSYLIDRNGKVATSSKVSLGIDAIQLPTSLGNKDTSYVADPKFKNDKNLIDIILSGVLEFDTTYIESKIGTIKECTISVGEDNASLNAVISIESTTNGNKNIEVSIGNLKTSNSLEIDNYLAAGNTYKPLSNEIKKVVELSSKNCYSEFNLSSKTGKDILYLNQDGYMAIDYYDNTATDSSGDPYVDVVYIPVCDIDNIVSNIYMIPYDPKTGELSASLDNPASFKEDYWCFDVSDDTTYFDGSSGASTMFAYMYCGFVTGIPYLGIYSLFSEDYTDELYRFGDYMTILEDGSKGFYTYDSMFLDEFKNVFGTIYESAFAQNGYTISGAAIICDFDKFSDDGTTLDLLCEVTSSSGYGFLDLADYTGFGSSKCEIAAAKAMIDAIYPEE